jgi:hypothetical protein
VLLPAPGCWMTGARLWTPGTGASPATATAIAVLCLQMHNRAEAPKHPTDRLKKRQVAATARLFPHQAACTHYPVADAMQHTFSGEKPSAQAHMHIMTNSMHPRAPPAVQPCAPAAPAPCPAPC